MSTVTITCACGKMLRAKSADAGKKCKCVGCGKILTIPAESTEAQTVATNKTAVAKSVAAKPVSRVAAKPAARSRAAVKTPASASADASLDPLPLDDLLSDLAIGPVDPPRVFELPEAVERVALPGSGRSKPVALSKAERAAAPAVGETLAARSMLGSRPRPEATGRGGSFHIDWKYPALAIAAVVVVGLVIFIKLGPAKAAAEWTRAEQDGQNVIESVVGKALKAYLATSGGWTPGDSHYQPAVKSVDFLVLPVMVTMPDKVGMHGDTTHGKFVGFYYTRTGETEADMDVYGTKLHITGHIGKDGKVLAEVNGKVVEIPDVVQRDHQDYK